MAKTNKSLITRFILDKVAPYTERCTKLEMDNIVFPKWDDLGLLGMIFRQQVRTKEQPEGHLYDEAVFQVVMRVISGRVLMTGGRPDAYTWKHDKVAKSKDVRFIGTNSAEAVINLSSTLMSVTDDDEKRLLADLFCNMRKDLLLITSPAEERHCVEITQELYNDGVTACVDEWMPCDENGEADTTTLNVGDFLIISADSVYCIRRDEFLETHALYR